jgi:glycosyltransferase involved in cell wall biosynthesis
MRILIVNLHLNIGGVETLLARLIPLLQREGVEITLVILQKKINQELFEALTPYCSVKFVGEALPFSRSSLQKFFGGGFDVAIYTISQAVLIGSWLLSRAGYSDTRAVLLACQTEIFCAEIEGWRYHRRMVQMMIKDNIPSSSIIFGNTASRDFHANKLQINLDASPIIRLFVDIEKYKNKDRKNLERSKIVSIGRITGYKTYNFTILSVIKRLLDSGLNIEWHVYGDGDQFDKFVKAITTNKLEGFVFAHGALNYSKVQHVLDDAFLFIGSGTSLIEAAACGVPALTTIEYSREALTYGYISQIEGFNMIEPGLDKPTYHIEERIKHLISLTHEEYSILQAENFSKAVQYSGKSVIKEYIKVFESAQQNGTGLYINSFQIIIYAASALLGFIVNKFREMTSIIKN